MLKRGMLPLCRTVLKYSPKGFFFFLLEKVLYGILPSIRVYLFAGMVDAVLHIGREEADWMCVVPLLLAVFLVQFAGWILREAESYVTRTMKMEVEKKYSLDLMRKISVLKYEYFEEDETRNLISRITDQGWNKVVDGYINLLSMAGSLISVAGISIIVAGTNPLVGGVILLFDIPIVLLAWRNGTVTYEANQETTRYKRNYQYLESVLLSRESVCERKLFHAFDKWNSRWKEEYDHKRRLEMAAFMRYFLSIRLNAVAEIICICFILAALAVPVLEGGMTAGLYFAVSGNLIQLFQLQAKSMTYCISSFVGSVKYMEEVCRLLEYEEVRQEAVSGAKDAGDVTIVCSGLKFKYPNAAGYSLDGVSLTLEPDKRYAFVGRNGSGKTTLMKLFVGLYTSYEGSLLINGREARDYGTEELRRLFSVVFQDYAKYGISVEDNVAIGNIDRMEEARGKAQAALQDLGLWEEVRSLKDGAKTTLGKVKKDSADLSLGQWQKLALARGLVSDAPVKILDEPTAALDPNLECEFYRKYEELCGRSETILVSHRLASVQNADRIFVLDGGKVAEAGTHDELMGLKGLYYEMFTQQRKWYD
ncbi:MAG: ABC transporter ATP-binding protein/permease [Roseburia sp.]|nr:ABC transporter ATP-binding protein/permease [Roseburia sp.]MCM1096618.1 ABC transporter ATP-binding protein/permease [Ruminococcus flavefaciens]